MRWTPHITVAAIAEQDGRYLVVEEMIGDWRVINQPAGHWEEGETLKEAVIREAMEETAWHFVPESIIGIYQLDHPTKRESYLRIAFHGTVTQQEPNQPLDNGIIRCLWMSREELAAKAPDQLRTSLVLRCIDDHIAGKHYPLSLLTNVV